MLLKDEDAEVRGAAVRLFGTLPDQVLCAQSDLIIAFATSAEASVRRGVDPVIQRLSVADAGFRQALLAGLLDALFRSETGEGLPTWWPGSPVP